MGIRFDELCRSSVELLLLESDRVCCRSTERTRSAIRKRLSFQAKMDRKIVLLGKRDMLSMSSVRVRAGLYSRLDLAW